MSLWIYMRDSQDGQRLYDRTSYTEDNSKRPIFQEGWSIYFLGKVLYDEEIVIGNSNG